MPPSSTDPVSRGWKTSLTSNCFSSPVPQQDTYSQRSSTDRSMSETSGGTAPNGWSAGGRAAGSAGAGGGQVSGIGRLGRNGDDLAGGPPPAVLVPQPHRSGEVLHTDHHPDEAPGL